MCFIQCFCVYVRTISVGFPSLGMSLCVVHVCFLVCSLDRKQSSWAWQCLELLKSLWCALRSKWGFMCVFVSCVTFLPWPALAVCVARIQCAVVSCCFFLLSLSHPVTLTFTQCLSGWNSSGLNSLSWQQPTAYQSDSTVTEKRKQKIRYEVSMGLKRGERMVLELPSTLPFEVHVGEF